MLAEWTAECSEESPTLVLPWSDAASGLHYVDLRENPYDIAEVAEAELYPALGRALRALNATRSPLLTAKCDAWSLTATNEHAETLEGLKLELDADPDGEMEGFASYIDLIWRDRSVFASPHQQQDRLDRIVRRAQRMDRSEAKLELTLRPCVLDRESVLEGYAFTLYVSAIGADHGSAMRAWELALEDVVALLRSRDFELVRGSATIDSRNGRTADDIAGASSSIG